jgi:hypothetical protein
MTALQRVAAGHMTVVKRTLPTGREVVAKFYIRPEPSREISAHQHITSSRTQKTTISPVGHHRGLPSERGAARKRNTCGRCGLSKRPRSKDKGWSECDGREVGGKRRTRRVVFWLVLASSQWEECAGGFGKTEGTVTGLSDLRNDILFGKQSACMPCFQSETLARQ